MSHAARHPFSAPLRLEFLEDRLVPAWAAVPPASVALPAPTRLTLNSNLIATGSAAITRQEVDYYAFTAPSSGSYTIRATASTRALDTVLGLYTSGGRRLGFNNNINSTNRNSSLTCNLIAGQRYVFGITNLTRTPGGAYTWRVQGTVPDDRYEENDTQAQATNLGTLTTPLTLANLALADAADWFRFNMNGAGRSGDSISLSFNHSRGDLDLRLYDSSGSLLRFSNGVSGTERVSLQNLAAGTYFVQVYGYQGAKNPAYSLTIDPGTSTGPGLTPHRALYLNFDGAEISHADLNRWAGSDWSSFADRIDSDGDGVRVSPLWEGRNEREALIERIVQLVQEDLQPFGLDVIRHDGLAIEEVGATTAFLGKATLTNTSGHISSEVDIGNENLTDICFIQHEDWGSVERTALALADVVLHEAGHTWGLWHVDSGNANESMGLRYSTTSSQWIQNSTFLDRTFLAYVGANGQVHGPGPQNSYQTMLRIFGSGSANRNSSLPILLDTSRSGVLSLTTNNPTIDRIQIRRLTWGTIEILANGRVYELPRNYREIVIYTAGDQRDQVRVLGSLGNLRVRVVRQQQAELLAITKTSQRQQLFWSSGSFSPDVQDTLCACPMCLGTTARTSESNRS